MKRELRLLVDGSEARPDDDRRAAETAAVVGAAAGRGGLDALDHEAILALALGDDAARFDETERAQATALREALERGQDHPLGGVVAAVRAAAGLGELAPGEHEALMARAIGAATEAASPAAAAVAQTSAGGGASDVGAYDGRGARQRPPRRMRTWGWVAFGSFAAAAAALVLALRSQWLAAPSSAGLTGSSPAAFLRARSTDGLFDPAVPFQARGGESKRLSRIANARAADLRANRFASWGVR